MEFIGSGTGMVLRLNPRSAVSGRRTGMSGSEAMLTPARAPGWRRAWMVGRTPVNIPVDAQLLIKEARAARERQAAERVGAHIRTVLCRFKSRARKASSDAE
jgi:hypothetical protein